MKLVTLLLALILTLSAQASTVMTSTEGTATTTSTQVLDSNVSRRYLLIQNKGAVSIYVKTQAAHEAGEEGVVIVAGGNWEPFIIPVDKIFIKSASSTADYTLIEGK